MNKKCYPDLDSGYSIEARMEIFFKKNDPDMSNFMREVRILSTNNSHFLMNSSIFQRLMKVSYFFN